MKATVAMLAAVVATAWMGVVRAAVLDLTPENFDDVVGGEKGAFVEFFAPWCGHCKALAPEYDVVGSTFKDTDPVVIAKVDADAHRELASRFEVTGYPTLKYFPAKSTTPEDYSGGRTAEDIVDFVSSRTGLHRKVKKAPTAARALTAATFDAVALDTEKAVLVEFFAPWCGHCKALKPAYEEVAKTFEAENYVVVATVDATKEEALASRYGVSGYPTIKFFPKGETEPEDYKGSRDAQAFIDFLNENAGTERELGGGLGPNYGRVEAMDELALLFVASGDREDILQRAQEKQAQLSGQEAAFAKHYIKTMEKIIARGDDYVSKELDRLDGMINSDSVKPKNKDLFRTRSNIIKAFA